MSATTSSITPAYAISGATAPYTPDNESHGVRARKIAEGVYNPVWAQTWTTTITDGTGANAVALTPAIPSKYLRALGAFIKNGHAANLTITVRIGTSVAATGLIDTTKSYVDCTVVDSADGLTFWLNLKLFKAALADVIATGGYAFITGPSTSANVKTPAFIQFMGTMASVVENATSTVTVDLLAEYL
jgi:hypothetical protein